MTLVQVFFCVFLNLRYLSKYSAQIYRAQYGAAMLVYLHGTPTWRPENSADICNLLSPSRRLIICTEQKGVDISYYTITSENYEKGIHFRQTLKFKMRWFPDEASY